MQTYFDIFRTFELRKSRNPFKKPSSRVYIDIPPVIVNEVSDILAIPLYHIYKSVYKTLKWPNIWKAESVNVIPKNSAPADMSQLRNLSCTPKGVGSFHTGRTQKRDFSLS